MGIEELDKLIDGKFTEDIDETKVIVELESNTAGDEKVIEDESNIEGDGKALEIDEFCIELEGFELEKVVEESEDDKNIELESFRVVEITEGL